MKKTNVYELMSTELRKTSLDLSLEYMEIGIDKLFESEIAEKIPVLKQIKHIYDIGSYFKQRRFVKNIAIFLKEYSIESVCEEKRETFIQSLEDKKKQVKIIDYIMVYLDTIKTDEKVLLFSKLFKKYVEGSFDWDKFCFLSEIIEKSYYDDLKNLLWSYKLYLEESEDSVLSLEGSDLSSYKRLESLGIVDPIYEIITMTVSSPLTISYRINIEGRIISEIVAEIVGMNEIDVNG